MEVVSFVFFWLMSLFCINFGIVYRFNKFGVVILLNKMCIIVVCWGYFGLWEKVVYVEESFVWWRFVFVFLNFVDLIIFGNYLRECVYGLFGFCEMIRCLIISCGWVGNGVYKVVWIFMGIVWL